MAAGGSVPRPVPALKEFVFTEKLGQGSYAIVYKAFRKGVEREVVAVKCVQKSSLTKSAVENLFTEIEILKKVKSEYVVELKDFQWDASYIYLIMEYCSGGDLSKFIRQKRKLPESIVQRFLQQLGSALKFMRQKDICHMDLKPQNILLSNATNPILKLADFGFAQYLRIGEEATTLRGSLLYMAPEMLLKRQYDARVDLWSLGIILFECLFGQAPFRSESFVELAEKIKRDKPIEIPYGVDLSDNCRDLLLKLLNRNPDQRITFEEFFAHPFLDLDHMPTRESYQKGIDIVKTAIEFDNKGNCSEAVKLYYEGLLYLVPVVKCEPDRRKQDALRVKVKEYLGRAETLQKQLKSNLQAEICQWRNEGKYNSAITDGDGIDGNDIIVQDSKLKEAIETAKKAEENLYRGNFKEAFELFTKALNVLVPFLKEMDSSREKETLHFKTAYWLKKAEESKSLLAVERLDTNRVVNAVKSGEDINDIVNSLAAYKCNIQ